MDLLDLAGRCENANDQSRLDACCRDIHDIDERSNVNGSCAAYVYDLQEAKRLIPEGHGYVLACDESRVWARVVRMGSDEVRGHSAIRPGPYAETRALCAAALRARAAQ